MHKLAHTQTYAHTRAWCIVHDASCVLHRAWCVLHEAWCIMQGAWCLMHAAWCVVHDAWCMMHDAWCIMQDAWCLMHVTRCTVHDAWWMQHDARRNEHDEMHDAPLMMHAEAYMQFGASAPLPQTEHFHFDYDGFFYWPLFFLGPIAPICILIIIIGKVGVWCLQSWHWCIENQ